MCKIYLLNKMKLKFTSVLMVALMAATMVFAQEVDKSKVQSQAAAAQGAQADLKKVDTGDKAWKFSGSLGLNAAATGLVNWTAGGNNNVNGVVYGRFRLLYHQNSIAWDTNLDMEYGLTWIDQESDKFQKSSDKLNFATKFGWEFEKSWYLTALAGFQTQFAYGRAYDGTEAADPIISKFMAPSYTDLSLGIDWKPNDIFSIYLSPVAGRITTVCVGKKLQDSYQEEFGVNLDETLKETYAVWKYNDDSTKNYSRDFRGELGLSLKASIDYKYKELSVKSTLGLFTPYAWDKTVVGHDDYYNKDLYRDNNRRFGHFDVDWTVNLGYQFFNCLQVTLSTDLRYYNGVMIDKLCKDDACALASAEHTHAKERVQFKGIIGIGVGYSF